jgi:superfamily II DNA or RNA helicase
MFRTFQYEFIDLVKQIKDRAVDYRDIFADITPGGGKSSLPLILHALIPTIADKICWVVPRRALAMQAERSFIDKTLSALFQCRGTINWSDNTANPCKGTDGCVVTYDSLVANPMLYEHEFARHRYILFLDEPHHMRHEPMNDYCRVVGPLIQKAVLRVFASGTWQRGDERSIGHAPYVRGHDGLLHLQFPPPPQTIVYRRIDAIQDHAIVPLFFDGINGQAKWKDAKGTDREVFSFDEALASEVGAMLNVVLETEYARALLQKTVRAWQAHQQRYPPAKLLIVAPRQYVARQYSTWLREDFGLRVPVATTDEESALERIKTFKSSTDPLHAALITVGMASEGLDVPDITHLACLTRYRTAPWIYQCFARACRIAPGKTTGYIYTPNDPEMEMIIQTIKLEQFGTAREPEPPKTDSGKDGDGDDELPNPIIPLGSRMTTNRGYDFEETLSEHETAKLEAVLARYGLLGIHPLQLKRASEAYREMEDPDIDMPEALTQFTPSETRFRFRKRIDRYCKQVDQHVWGGNWGTTALEINKRFGKKHFTLYDEHELEQIWLWINEKYPLTSQTEKG